MVFVNIMQVSGESIFGPAEVEPGTSAAALIEQVIESRGFAAVDVKLLLGTRPLSSDETLDSLIVEGDQMDLTWVEARPLPEGIFQREVCTGIHQKTIHTVQILADGTASWEEDTYSAGPLNDCSYATIKYSGQAEWLGEDTLKISLTCDGAYIGRKKEQFDNSSGKLAKLTGRVGEFGTAIVMESCKDAVRFSCKGLTLTSGTDWQFRGPTV